MRRRTQLLNLLTHTLQIIRRLLTSGGTRRHRNNRLTTKALKEAGMLQLIRGNSLLQGINTLGVRTAACTSSALSNEDSASKRSACAAAKA